MIKLRGLIAADADMLFPLVFQSPVTDTILWDGPSSLEEYQKALIERAAQHARGEIHFFTIIEAASSALIGSISFRPQNGFRADIGLWIGEAFHGKGYGTLAVREILNYGFTRLKFSKIEATVFVGNIASRRIFEKNGFRLEGTIRCAVRKRGQLVDEWLLGITSEEYDSTHSISPRIN